MNWQKSIGKIKIFDFSCVKFYFIRMFDCKSFMKRMGWKQDQLAERLGVGTSTVGMWCSGKSFPHYKELVKLLRLGMTFCEMFGEEFAPAEKPANNTDIERQVKDVLRSMLR